MLNSVIDMKASELKEMQSGEIVRIHLNEKDAKRLFYLGVYKGAIITMIRKAPFQDPYIFYVQQSHIILRKKDAAMIEVIER